MYLEKAHVKVIGTKYVMDLKKKIRKEQYYQSLNLMMAFNAKTYLNFQKTYKKINITDFVV